MPPAKKLIEVAMPLDAINAANAREKSIRHGDPSTLYLWRARRRTWLSASTISATATAGRGMGAIATA